MVDKYVRLQDGRKMKIYSCDITNACILKFIDTDVETVKNFLGTDMIDSIDIVDENDKLMENHNISMKRKTILFENTTITEYEERVVQEAYDEEIKTEVTNPDSDEPVIKVDVIHHEAVTETIEKQVSVELITAILEKPSVQEELETVKTAVGLVNTNNMTLEEFKEYYKGVIGRQCTAMIEKGVDVETTFGTQHFSYTIEDQSNIKDLIITGIVSDFALPLPYHADGILCDAYQPIDILKIYMALSSNKTYHTTYCNILNAMINKAPDITSVKNITYGMDISEKEYQDVITKINESKDALLALVEGKLETIAEK